MAIPLYIVLIHVRIANRQSELRLVISGRGNTPGLTAPAAVFRHDSLALACLAGGGRPRSLTLHHVETGLTSSGPWTGEPGTGQTGGKSAQFIYLGAHFGNSWYCAQASGLQSFITAIRAPVATFLQGVPESYMPRAKVILKPRPLLTGCVPGSDDRQESRHSSVFSLAPVSPGKLGLS